MGFKYVKAFLSALVSGVGALVVALGTGNNMGIGDLGWRHWLLAIAAVLGSGGMVWLTQNGPWHPYIKTVVAFLSAGIASLVVALQDGVITQGEWLVAFTAAVVATGFVFQANDPTVPAFTKPTP